MSIFFSFRAILAFSADKSAIRKGLSGYSSLKPFRILSGISGQPAHWVQAITNGSSGSSELIADFFFQCLYVIADRLLGNHKFSGSNRKTLGPGDRCKTINIQLIHFAYVNTFLYVSIWILPNKMTKIKILVVSSQFYSCFSLDQGSDRMQTSEQIERRNNENYLRTGTSWQGCSG